MLLETIQQIESHSLAYIDKFIDMRVNFEGKRNYYSIDFCNLKKLQENFEGDE